MARPLPIRIVSEFRRLQSNSVTSRYIKTSYLGRMLAAAQEDISAHLVKALGSPRGLA